MHECIYRLWDEIRRPWPSSGEAKSDPQPTRPKKEGGDRGRRPGFVSPANLNPIISLLRSHHPAWTTRPDLPALAPRLASSESRLIGPEPFAAMKIIAPIMDRFFMN